jgi:hypothetical protein
MTSLLRNVCLDLDFDSMEPRLGLESEGTWTQTRDLPDLDSAKAC